MNKKITRIYFQHTVLEYQNKKRKEIQPMRLLPHF